MKKIMNAIYELCKAVMMTAVSLAICDDIIDDGLEDLLDECRYGCGDCGDYHRLLGKDRNGNQNQKGWGVIPILLSIIFRTKSLSYNGQVGSDKLTKQVSTSLFSEASNLGV